MIGAWFAKEAGIQLEHVPYRGAGQAVTDLLAGHVKFGILGPAALMPHAKAGTLILIAQTGEQRAKSLPDVPTLVEGGYKEMVLESWFGLFAPPKTPPEFIKALNGAMRPRWRCGAARELRKGSLEPMGGTPESASPNWRNRIGEYQRLSRN